jgi:hypothetical protein
MHDFYPVWLFLLAALGILITFFALRSRQATQLPQIQPRDPALPPISAADAQRIFAQARSAAMDRAMGHTDPRNPYPPGTRANILWETEFCRALMDITH